MEEYIISKAYLDEILDKSARTLVGTLLKKTEVLEKENSFSPNLLKSLSKETVYEHFRNLKELVKSFSHGVKFVSKSQEKSKESLNEE